MKNNERRKSSGRPSGESLDDIGRRMRATMATSACGPLIVAAEVMGLSKTWDAYKAEVGGATITSWLRTNQGPGRGLDWFRKRNDAVLLLGEDVRRSLHHEVAVWISQSVSEDKRVAVKKAVQEQWVRQRRVPLTLRQAKRIAWMVLGEPARKPRPACAACEKKAAEIARLEEMYADACIRMAGYRATRPVASGATSRSKGQADGDGDQSPPRQ